MSDSHDTDASLNGDGGETSEAVRHLGELIKGVEIAMLTTVDEHGGLRSRPMATQDVDFDGTLWFFTQLRGGKADELAGDERVNLSYAKPDDQQYVSVSGRGIVVKDRVKMEELWRTRYRAWFPDGLDDPDLALLMVEVDRAEFWDAPLSGVAVQLLGFARAVLTGKPYRDSSDSHRKLEFPRPGLH